MPASSEFRASVGSFVSFLLLVSSYVLITSQVIGLLSTSLQHIKEKNALFFSDRPLKVFLIPPLSICIIHKYALFSS